MSSRRRPVAALWPLAGGDVETMEDRLRVCRLTLAPAARTANDEAWRPVASPEEDRFRAMEHLARVSVVAQEAMTKPGPHVHGVEDSKGSRFWALETESEDSDHDSVVSIDRYVGIYQASTACGFLNLRVDECREGARCLPNCRSTEGRLDGKENN